MLLNDIGKSPTTIFRKINHHLQANYGFKIAEDVSDQELVSIMEQIEGELTDLKIKGDDAKSSSEVSKRLLILEGIKTLREFAVMQFQSPDLDKVINGMTDFVCDHFRLGGMHSDDFEEAVRDAMKQYRSSKYRFPDDLIEHRVRENALARIHSLSDVNSDLSDLDMGSMFEDGETPIEDSEMNGFGSMMEGDPWANTPQGSRQRDTSLGGHAASIPNTQRAAEIMKSLDNPSLELEPQTDKMVPMIRDKHGRMVPDPFAAQKLQRMKGIVGEAMNHKENLVKNLRKLLETEVSQAEVMMAAKGFAQELQEMIEKIGRLQNEDLPPVTDQMRETYGTDSSSAFQTQIYGALQGVMDSLYTAKNQVDDAVSNMASTGKFDAQTDMDLPIDGMDDVDTDLDTGMDADLDNIAGDLEAEDEFGGAEEQEPLGRSVKTESLQRKISEMKKLIEKARFLKESNMSTLDEMDLDEGVRQDTAISIFNKFLPKRTEANDKEFRKVVINTIMQDLGVDLSAAAGLYNYARIKANLPDLGRTAQRAAAGKPPVVRGKSAPKQLDMFNQPMSKDPQQGNLF